MKTNKQHPILSAPRREQERWLRDHGWFRHRSDEEKYWIWTYGLLQRMYPLHEAIKTELAAEAIREKRKARTSK